MEKKDFISKREALNQIIEENKKELEELEEEYAKELFYQSYIEEAKEIEENLKNWGYDFFYMLSYSIMKGAEEGCISIRRSDGVSSHYFGTYEKDEFFDKIYFILRCFYNFLGYHKNEQV